MLTIAAILLWLIALIPAAALIWFSIEVLAGLAPLRNGKDAPAATPTRAAVLVPAHDEAAVIGTTISALRAAAPDARIVVIADNCRDDTAALARAAGAEVLERVDPLARGKGHALAFGRDHLMLDPPGAVIILDADCRITAGGVARLADRTSGGHAVQAVNLVIADGRVAPQVAISNFAFMVKNLFRARGMARIGGSGLLFGTGMAFPWAMFKALPLATSDATEDIRLGIELALAGKTVCFADDVRVTSPPPALEHSRGQRSRWEHGFLRSMARDAPRLLASGIRHASRARIAVGMHMMVPPLALLIAAGIAAMAVALPVAWYIGLWHPPVVLGSAIIFAGIAVNAAWACGGRSVMPARVLLQIPRYILWKLPIYAALGSRRQSDWNRTERTDAKR